jgi:hypothetical protein
MASWSRLNKFAQNNLLREYEQKQQANLQRDIRKLEKDIAAQDRAAAGGGRTVGRDTMAGRRITGGGGGGARSTGAASIDPREGIYDPRQPAKGGDVNITPGFRDEAGAVPGSGAQLPPNVRPQLDQLGRDAVSADPNQEIGADVSAIGGTTFGTYTDVNKLQENLEGAGVAFTAEDLAGMSHEEKTALAKKLSGKGELGTYEQGDVGTLTRSGMRSQRTGRYSVGGITDEVKNTEAGKAYTDAVARSDRTYRQLRQQGASARDARSRADRTYNQTMKAAGLPTDPNKLRQVINTQMNDPTQFLTSAAEGGEYSMTGDFSKEYWQGKYDEGVAGNVSRQENINAFRQDLRDKAEAEKQRHIDQYGYDLRDVPPEYREQVAQERRATEEHQTRLDEIREEREASVDAWKEREERLGSQLEGYGEAERSKLSERREKLLAKTRQDLRSRGLTSSTALESALRGIERGAAKDLRDLNERITKEKMTYMSQLTGDTLQAQQAATDFAAAIAESRWQSMTQVYNRMSEATQSNVAQRQAALDRMLQRSIADTQASTQRFAATTSAAASRYGSQQSAQAQRYSAEKQYQAQMSGQSTDLKKALMQMKLGFAEMGTKKSIAALQADAQVSAARAGKTGRTFFDLAAEGKIKTKR